MSGCYGSVVLRRRRPGRPSSGGATIPAGLMAAVNNLTSRVNFSGFGGIQTSPFFLTPTAAQNPRKADIGVGLRF